MPTVAGKRTCARTHTHTRAHTQVYVNTGRRGWLNSTSASYRGDPGFKHRSKRPISRLRHFYVFPQRFQKTETLVFLS
jgi:hypothetical protein